MPKLPPAILFDLDDTILVAFGPASRNGGASIGAFAENLAPLTPAAAIAAIMDSSRELWADPAGTNIGATASARRAAGSSPTPSPSLRPLGMPVPERSLGDAIADRYNALHDEELAMFPDAHETLDRLKELGVDLALITNGAAEPQRAKVVRFALEHRFDHIQIEGEHGFGKPEERAYTHAMAVLGVARARPGWSATISNGRWSAPQRLGIHAIWHDGYGVGLPPGSPDPARPHHPRGSASC